jgi:hypothetical protein
LVGEDDNYWYCERPAYASVYDRVSEKYGFFEPEWVRRQRKWYRLEPEERNKLIYFMKSVVPNLDMSLDDAILVAWWAYFEHIFEKRFNAPWGFVNCLGKAINDTSGLDCKSIKSGQWQVGYGVQVGDNLGKLRASFDRIYPKSTLAQVGNQVLDAAGIKLRFPTTLDWKDLTTSQTMPNVLGSGRSNHFWASILMRDPRISADLSAKVLNAGGFPCFKPSHPRWCDRAGYPARRSEASMKVHTIIYTWSEHAGDEKGTSEPAERIKPKGRQP